MCQIVCMWTRRRRISMRSYYDVAKKAFEKRLRLVFVCRGGSRKENKKTPKTENNFSKSKARNEIIGSSPSRIAGNIKTRNEDKFYFFFVHRRAKSEDIKIDFLARLALF